MSWCQEAENTEGRRREGLSLLWSKEAEVGIAGKPIGMASESHSTL
jgi:hypothetical protein